MECKLQVRVTDDRRTLQRKKEGSPTTQNLQFFNLFFQKESGLELFSNFSSWKQKAVANNFYLKMCAETWNTIIQRDMFQTSQQLKMLSGSNSLLMGLPQIDEVFLINCRNSHKGSFKGYTSRWRWFSFLQMMIWFWLCAWCWQRARGGRGNGGSLTTQTQLFQSDHDDVMA